MSFAVWATFIMALLRFGLIAVVTAVALKADSAARRKVAVAILRILRPGFPVWRRSSPEERDE